MWLGLAGIVALAAVLRFAAIGEQSFWFDEYFSVVIANGGLGELIDAVRETEKTPPLYYVLALAWERAFGDGEAAMRSLSALFGVATVPVVFEAARRLVGARSGLIAAALVATSPLLVWYSQEARAYALLVLLAALALLCFVRALDEPQGRRWLWGWALASGLALLTHYAAIAAIAPQAAWLIARRPGRLESGAAIGAVGLVALALAPLVAMHDDGVNWIELLDLGDRVGQSVVQFAVGLQVPWPAIAPLAIGALALALALALSRLDAATRRAAALTASVALAGAALVFALALAGPDFLITRNLLAIWPAAAVALAVVLGAPAVPRIAGGAAAMTICAAGIALSVWVAATPAAQKPDWRELAAALGPAGEARTIAGPSADNQPLLLYLPGAELAPPGAAAETSRLALVSYRGVADHAIGPCWWGTVCGGEPLFDAQPPIEVPSRLGPASTVSSERLVARLYAGEREATLPPSGYFYPYLVEPAR